MSAIFSDLIGKTILKIEGDVHSDVLRFYAENGNYRMCHYRDCCENVSIEDIDGDLGDLLNTPVLDAYESTNSNLPGHNDDESFTWTFYVIRTMKATVTIRWYGSSNGYYSESVDFEKE